MLQGREFSVLAYRLTQPTLPNLRVELKVSFQNFIETFAQFNLKFYLTQSGGGEYVCNSGYSSRRGCNRVTKSLVSDLFAQTPKLLPSV